MILLCGSDWLSTFKLVTSASKELVAGSTDGHQYFWLGPEYVEIPDIHFRSPSGYVLIEHMMVVILKWSTVF